MLSARQVQDVPPFQAAHPGERQPRCAPFQYTAKVPVLLNHIRARDESMDEAQLNKMENIKKALPDGTYHVSAAEAARTIIDSMREP